jgi:hypothetical protein
MHQNTSEKRFFNKKYGINKMDKFGLIAARPNKTPAGAFLRFFARRTVRSSLILLKELLQNR